MARQLHESEDGMPQAGKKRKPKRDKNMIKKLKKFYYKYILRKKYIRTGFCLKCGQCCQNIYIKHDKNVIADEKEFYYLNQKGKYLDFEVIGKDDTGLVFKCKLLDEESKLCKNHKIRDFICRRYPQEEIFTFGAKLAQGCGYKFEPIESFEDVLKRVERMSHATGGKKA